MKEKNSIWITWEHQIRNESMSKRLGSEYFQILFNGARYKRYIYCISKTVQILIKNRKKIVFVQNPSIVLSLVSVLLQKILRYKLIIDAHNSGVYPKKVLQPIADFINKHATFVIVTNPSLADYVRSLGGNPVILPDPLPDMSYQRDGESDWLQMPKKSVMVICSWASDEPYLEVIRAAQLTPEVSFYITGNSKGREKMYGSEMPLNLTLTGFVSEQDYKAMLSCSSVVLDLTTREDCLVCGAYEAVAAYKPVILSNTKALRAYFGDVAYFTENDANSISATIKLVFDSYDSIDAEVKQKALCMENNWRSLFVEFRNKIFNN